MLISFLPLEKAFENTVGSSIAIPPRFLACIQCRTACAETICDRTQQLAAGHSKVYSLLICHGNLCRIAIFGLDAKLNLYIALRYSPMPKSAVVASCMLVFGVHLVAALITGNATWVSRSGAAVVAVGLLLESWKILITERADDMPFWSTQPGHSALRMSILIIIFGTLIQGHGDLVFSAMRR